MPDSRLLHSTQRTQSIIVLERALVSSLGFAVGKVCWVTHCVTANTQGLELDFPVGGTGALGAVW